MQTLDVESLQITLLSKIFTLSWSSAHSAPQSKIAVSTNIKHSRYIHLMSNFLSIHVHTKRLYVHVWHSRYSLFSWKRIDRLLITSGIVESKRKYSVCDLKCRYYIFTLWGSTSLPSCLHAWCIPLVVYSYFWIFHATNVG